MLQQRASTRARAALGALIICGCLAAPVRAQDTVDVVPEDQPTAEAPPAERQELDQRATQELRAIYSRIPTLTDVDITVDGGVATLTGRTLTQEVRETAAELARERTNVVYVVNEIRVERSLSARTRAVLLELRADSLDWVARAPLLIAAALVVVLFGFLGRILGALPWLHRAFGRSQIAEDMTRRVARIVVWGVGLVLALQLLDATALVGALLGAAGVAGLAFGFAFRNIAENWLAGFLLSVRRPFELDDEVSIDGNEGRIVRLTHTDTVLMTPAGNHLRIPNGAVYNGKVENYTRNPLRVMSVRLSMPRDTDVEAARGALLGSLEDTAALTDPEPRALLVEVGDSHLVLELRAWVDQRQTHFRRFRSLAYQRAKDALAGAGITGPISEHTLHMAADRDADAGPRPSTIPSSPTEDIEGEDEIAAQVAADREASEDVNLLG